MCGVQEAADRVGQSWDVVESPLASESEPEGRVEANTTPISSSLMAFQSTTTIEFSPPKGASVLSARVELVNGTLQLTTTIRVDRSEDYSAHDATRALLGSWIPLRTCDGLYGT